MSFRGPEVVKKFEEQAGAEPITELSSGTPGTLWPTWYGGILSLTRYWSGSAVYCLGYDFSAVFPMVYFVLAIGHVGHAGVAKLVNQPSCWLHAY